MEQIYLVEVFIDKISIFVDENDTSFKNKNHICKMMFGPKQLIIKEDINAPKNNTAVVDENNHRKFSRTIRAGKSYMFPSYPDTMIQILTKYPLEIEVWNDDGNEEYNIFVGAGVMNWDTAFFVFLRDTESICVPHEPLAIKSVIPLMSECCCKQCGEISLIVRISALGDSIITDILQLMAKPDHFIFVTNKTPSKYECKRIERDSPNFALLGSLYEEAVSSDPEVIANENKKIEVCAELQSCGIGQPIGHDKICTPGDKDAEEGPKSYPIDKIRMGDITGPCANPNCKLAHKVRTYIRTLDTYKKEYSADPGPPKSERGQITKKVCGKCDCKDDKWHYERPDSAKTKVTCKGCGGRAQPGHTCNETKDNLYNTGVSPTASRAAPDSKSGKGPTVNYVLNITRDPELMASMFGNDFTVQNASVNCDYGASCSQVQEERSSFFQNTRSTTAVNVTVTENCLDPGTRASTRSLGQTETDVCYTETKDNKRNINLQNNFQIYNCVTIPDDKDCKCELKVPTPACKTADCECIPKLYAERNRKIHKPYCPAYKHKPGCPAVVMVEHEEVNELEDELEPEPLPYGLPPIRVGPCPVMGRPCSVPDGFARMYKIGSMPPQPPSYSDAGKVCCSKEYERIKKAIREYLKNEKPADFRCINKFNVDTEKRCCDKDNYLLSLMGKDCCGSHKMAIQEKYKFAPGLPQSAFPKQNPSTSSPAPPK